MKVFEKKGWFRITIPDGWDVDEDEEPLALYDPDGPGALQITAQPRPPLKPGEKMDVYLMLRAYLRMTGVDIEATDSRRYFDRGLEWATAEYAADSPEEGRVLFRAWLVTDQEIVVFLTYACAEEERDRERESVEKAVASLEIPQGA